MNNAHSTLRPNIDESRMSGLTDLTRATEDGFQNITLPQAHDIHPSSAHGGLAAMLNNSDMPDASEGQRFKHVLDLLLYAIVASEATNVENATQP